jgi:thioredoxin-like negative regulator of GroEL
MDKENDILIDNIDERIEAFLRGNMSAEEETDFKQEIKNNPELRSRAMEMASLIKGVQRVETAKEERLIDSVNNNRKHKTHPIWWWACSAAAVVAIIFGVYKERRYNMLDSTVSPYYTEYNVSDITRGETDSATISHLYTIFNQVQEKRNVSDAIKELESIYVSLDSDYTYYPFANDIMWNLALAYIKDDQIEKATILLEKTMEENPDTPIFKKANELLKKLKDL